MRVQILKLNTLNEKNGWFVRDIELPQSVKVYRSMDDEYDAVGVSSNFKIKDDIVSCDIMFFNQKIVDNIKKATKVYVAPMLVAIESFQDKGITMVTKAKIKYLGLVGEHQSPDIKPLKLK